MTNAMKQAQSHETFSIDIVAIRQRARQHIKDGAVTVWESLAICEHLAERYPAARLWPEEPAARGLARSVSSEMHAGFADLRRARSTR